MKKDHLSQSAYLVVDDDDMACEVLGRTLSLVGAKQVSFAADPADALRLAQQQRPDFILLDLYMPDEEAGWALLEQLRRAAPQAAVIMVTGSRLTADFMQSMEQRVDGYCIKPVLPDLLEKTLLGARQRRSPSRA